MRFQAYTLIDPFMFETITPSRFTTFTMPNLLTHRWLLHSIVLRVAILDSPIADAADEFPLIAAMIVPTNRERDWNFCTISGHLQLLYSFHNVSRLILIGNDVAETQEPSVYKRPSTPDTVEKEILVKELQPILMAMHPKVSFQFRLPETLFLTYEDDVLYRVIIARQLGPIVGEFVVEDVELQGSTHNSRILRRRMRFKRMPNLIQSQVPLIPIIGDDNGEGNTEFKLESLRKMKNVKFEIDTRVLVHQYLAPMVAGLFLIVYRLNEIIEQGFAPRALCLGIGGGVLLSFLDTVLGFEVVGVEVDELVLTAATQHFGLNKKGTIRLLVGDAINVIQNFPPKRTKRDKDDSEVDKDGGDKADPKVHKDGGDKGASKVDKDSGDKDDSKVHKNGGEKGASKIDKDGGDKNDSKVDKNGGDKDVSKVDKNGGDKESSKVDNDGGNKNDSKVDKNGGKKDDTEADKDGKDNDDSKVDKDNDGSVAKIDVIMVDLDSSEYKNGISAPPPEFMKKSVFKGARKLLDDHGVLIINVVPLNELFYTTLIKELKETFHKVHGIDVGNQDNFVVMATVSPPSSNDNDNAFLKRLKSAIPGNYMDSIVEL